MSEGHGNQACDAQPARFSPLFDAAGKLAYHGQFDKTRPSSGKPATGRDLRAAVEALLAGQAPAAEQRPSVGCNLKWK